MESNRKRSKVVMLPTNGKDVAMLSKRTKDGMLQSANGREGVANCNKMWQPQHLYFTTDEEIKEGDWFIHPDATVPQNNFSDVYVDCKKIIATTDKTLNNNLITKGKLRTNYHLPQPSQAFIEKYCKLGGIDEVDVEYEEILGDWFEIPQPCRNIGGPYKKRMPTTYKLKVDSHNTIIIHPIEEQMYSRIQVENYLLELHLAILKAHVNEGSLSIFNSTKWIEENL